MLDSDYLLIELFKGLIALCLCLDIALPHPYHSPSGKTEVNTVGVVAGYIQGYFLSPEVNVGFGQSIILATLMSMPETTVDEHNSFVILQHNVRRAGQFAVVDTIAQSSGEKELPHNHLRFCILSLDCRHATATLLRCHHICHSPYLNFCLSLTAHHFLPMQL